MANLVSRSEPLTTQLTLKSGPTSAVAAVAGFAQSLQLSASSGVQFAYMQFVASADASYTFSVFLQMDDASAPNVTSSSVLGDLSLVLAGVAVATPTVTLLHDAVYRCSGATSGVSGNGNWGVVKYNTQSAKAFRWTGYQIEKGTLNAYESIPAYPVPGKGTTGVGS